MVKVVLIVREVGRLKPDYSLDFELPEIPAVGSYISIQRPNKPEPFGEDVVVRKVWWRLSHPETGSLAATPAKVGKVDEIYIECDVALGPWASDHWRQLVEGAQSRGIEIEEFEVARLSLREKDLSAENR